MSEKRAITVKDAARQLGIGTTLAYKLIANGELPAIRLGRRLVVAQHVIDALIEGPANADVG